MKTFSQFVEEARKTPKEARKTPKIKYTHTIYSIADDRDNKTEYMSRVAAGLTKKGISHSQPEYGGGRDYYSRMHVNLSNPDHEVHVKKKLDYGSYLRKFSK